MKVSISNTIEVTDEQREMLARVLDGKGGRKRKATREEFRSFIWAEGEDWAIALSDQYAEETGAAAAPADDEEEDLLGLIGDDSSDEDEDLI